MSFPFFATRIHFAHTRQVWSSPCNTSAAVRGVSTGALEETVMPFAVLFLVRWYYTRRLPVTIIVVAAVLVLPNVRGLGTFAESAPVPHGRPTTEVPDFGGSSASAGGEHITGANGK